MNSKFLLAIPLVGLLLTVMPFQAGTIFAEEPKPFIPDKALCAKMVRFGKQAYERGRYLDAKEYFRKAVQADPASPVAWRYYDQAVIFALAEKVEQNANLTLPGTSARQEIKTGAPSTAPPPPPPKPAAKGKVEFKILEDEGC